MQKLLQDIQRGDVKSLARAITLIENEVIGYEDLLIALPADLVTKVIGITGAPGAGKSTLVNAVLQVLIAKGKRVGIVCIDPSSPFNFGALLGDRIRMSEWYNHPNVFIRSLATHGSMGGLHPKIIEITDLMKAAPFDHIIVETVGVGQTEIEIAALADTTVVVVVPEGGDEVQTMKSGLMEIADVFVVNKSDRDGADVFVKNLKNRTDLGGKRRVPVIKTVASQSLGVVELLKEIEDHQNQQAFKLRSRLLAERAFFLIQKNRMKDISKDEIATAIGKQLEEKIFNLYAFVKTFH